MNKNTVRRLAALAGLGPVAMACAMAADDGYGYGGLSVGRSRVNIDEPRVTRSLLDQGLATTGIDSNRRDTGYKAFGGYQFNRNFAVEAGFFDLGRFGYTAQTSPDGTLHGDFRVRGFNLDAVGTLPFTENLAGLARVGVDMARTRATFSGTGAATPLRDSASERQANAKYGVGLQYAVSPGFLLRAEAEHYRIADAVGKHAGVNLFSVSAVFPFGRTASAAPRAAAMPAAYVAPPVVQAPVPAPPPVVAAVVPAPVVAAAPPPAPRQRVSFSAESMFTFDRSELRPEGKAALDRFAQELQGVQFDTISVEGHTDRLGSEAYNQRLSQQRADAVKDYLVGTRGVDLAKITAVGRSESTPVTAAGDCKGQAASASLIACLQPDRRVDIEVVGTRSR